MFEICQFRSMRSFTTNLTVKNQLLMMHSLPLSYPPHEQASNMQSSSQRKATDCSCWAEAMRNWRPPSRAFKPIFLSAKRYRRWPSISPTPTSTTRFRANWRTFASMFSWTMSVYRIHSRITLRKSGAYSLSLHPNAAYPFQGQQHPFDR